MSPIWRGSRCLYCNTEAVFDLSKDQTATRQRSGRKSPALDTPRYILVQMSATPPTPGDSTGDKHNDAISEKSRVRVRPQKAGKHRCSENGSRKAKKDTNWDHRARFYTIHGGCIKGAAAVLEYENSN